MYIHRLLYIHRVIHILTNSNNNNNNNRTCLTTIARDLQISYNDDDDYDEMSSCNNKM